jgi:hypothetical protein
LSLRPQPFLCWSSFAHTWSFDRLALGGRSMDVASGGPGRLGRRIPPSAGLTGPAPLPAALRRGKPVAAGGSVAPLLLRGPWPLRLHQDRLLSCRVGRVLLPETRRLCSREPSGTVHTDWPSLTASNLDPWIACHGGGATVVPARAKAYRRAQPSAAASAGVAQGGSLSYAPVDARRDERQSEAAAKLRHVARRRLRDLLIVKPPRACRGRSRC